MSYNNDWNKEFDPSSGRLAPKRTSDGNCDHTELLAALKWYEAQVSDCNKTSREGDIARDRLAKDHGDKARGAIAKHKAGKEG